MNVNLDINETQQRFNLGIGQNDTVSTDVSESGQTVTLSVGDSSEQYGLDADSTVQVFRVGLTESISISGITDYTGTYEVTPSGQMQTLSTRGLRTTQDIVVNPIPTNYGLITYNGTTITVS